MKQFGKKTEAILLVISVLGLLLGSVLVGMSGSLLYIIEEFLETKVFHLEFDLTEFADTINSLIAFPLFMVIGVIALLFVKFTDRAKVILISCCLVLVLVFIALCSYTRGIYQVSSDSASEILLAQECFREKSFWPLSWHYSTEIRLLNTQLITAPLFAFTDSWWLVKTISAVLLSLLLPLSLYFLLVQLDVQKRWVRLLCCLLIFSPWSLRMWDIVQFGNYYVPHIAIAFLYIGLFLALAYKSPSPVRRRVYGIIFFFLAFMSGLAGIRYILYFLFPLAATIVGLAAQRLLREKLPFSARSFFLSDKSVFYAFSGLIAGGLGYVGNNLVLSRIFSFAEYNTTTFTSIGDVSLADILDALLGTLGWRNGVSVFTPAGISNIFVCMGIVCLILCLRGILGNKEDGIPQVFLLFFVVMLIFNVFVIVTTDFTPRFFILPLVFVVPVIPVLLQAASVSIIPRYLMTLTLSMVFVAGAFLSFGTVLTTDFNKDKHAVAEFLQSNGYRFGYGSFWNANVFSYLSNGSLEVAHFFRARRSEVDWVEYVTNSIRPDRWISDRWLTPERYYQDDAGGGEKVFFLVTQDEYNAVPDAAVFANGQLVYNDEFYRVYEYANNDAFKQSFLPKLPQSN